MEKKLLLYIIYISLIDIRERSNDSGDQITFGICNLLHNLPLNLGNEADTKNAYESFCEKIETLGLQDWFNTRKEEFISRYPEYK